MRIILFLIVLVALGLSGCATHNHGHSSARLYRDGMASRQGMVLKGTDRLTTARSFKPPVEITLVAKTDSTNIRLGYAAEQVILGWELDPEQLRVDGGPANGLHKRGAGRIPRDEYVTIRWVVTPRHQALYVGDELRFEHQGDYSQIDKPVSVFPAADSILTVKSLRVKQLAAK